MAWICEEIRRRTKLGQDQNALSFALLAKTIRPRPKGEGSKGSCDVVAQFVAVPDTIVVVITGVTDQLQVREFFERIVQITLQSEGCPQSPLHVVSREPATRVGDVVTFEPAKGEQKAFSKWTHTASMIATHSGHIP